MLIRRSAKKNRILAGRNHRISFKRPFDERLVQFIAILCPLTFNAASFFN